MVAVMVMTLLAQAGQPGMGPVPVIVGTAVELRVPTEVEVVGSVEPQLATTLSAEIAGLTERFDLREGDVVQQGKTIVAQLKATDLELAVAEAEAELAKARAELTKLRRGLRQEEIDEKRAEAQEKKAWVEKYAKDVERAKALVARDMVSVSEFNQAEANYLAAKAQYERALRSLRVAELGFRQEEIAAAEAEVQRLQAKIERLREDLHKTVIRAPVSGFITQRYIEVGQWVERGGKVADIIDLASVLVRVPVHERDIRHIQVGDAATVLLDALPGRPFAGRVKHITPQADLASRTFPVKIEVANTPDHAIKAGMFARVTLRTGDARPSVFVPKDAVVRRGVGSVVFVVQETQARMVAVKTGRTHEGFVELLDGAVQAGDHVVVTGNETLQDQAIVAITSALRN
ncbi:MAG TPA: efflux RND transporter periplasmic adaptor subunit [Alphaproteobacteria bacterium]|nr:efflux RND transporter periplasmic adaptor subunit [Alphaproteobacteria bacterium]